jgi:alkane 1-monooxygenase
MDPRVARHYGGDLRKANLYPPKREALIDRWQHAELDDGKPELFPGSHVDTLGPNRAAAATRYQCTDCGYVYDQAQGCPHEGFAPGTPWSQIPDRWPCPDCAVREKVDFVPVA